MSNGLKTTLYTIAGLSLFAGHSLHHLFDVRLPKWLAVTLLTIAVVCFIVLSIDSIKNRGRKGSPTESAGTFLKLQ